MIESANIWAVGAESLAHIKNLPQLLAAERAGGAVALSAGPALDAEKAELPLIVRGDVAVVSLRGVMVQSYPWVSNYVASTAHVRAAVRAARADESIKAVLILANTPGGDVRGMPELGDEIAATAQEKPVVVQVENTLASAGYYVAARATAIYAGHVMHQVGSIGVRTVVWDTSAMYEQAGIKVHSVTTGEHKATGEDGVPVTDAQVAVVQDMVDALYQDFLAQITAGRGLAGDALASVADGRVFFAESAKKTGLIDGIQPLEKTLAELEKRSKTNAAANAALKRLAR